jgi:hypothetical protein
MHHRLDWADEADECGSILGNQSFPHVVHRLDLIPFDCEVESVVDSKSLCSIVDAVSEYGSES